MSKKKTQEIFKSESTSELLKDRGPSHGDYEDGALFAQNLKDMYRECPMWNKMSPVEKETLDLVSLKIARMLFGNFNRDDSADAAAYFSLVANLYNLDNTKKEPYVDYRLK